MSKKHQDFFSGPFQKYSSFLVFIFSIWRVQGNTLITKFESIVRNEGILQLWRGLPALVYRIFPYGGIQYLMNDFYRNKYNIAGFRTVSYIQVAVAFIS